MKILFGKPVKYVPKELLVAEGEHTVLDIVFGDNLLFKPNILATYIDGKKILPNDKENKKMQDQEKILFQYIRKGQKRRLNKKTKKMELISRGRPVGIMIAYKIDDNHPIGLGFTRFHLKKEKIWSDEFGADVAAQRAVDNCDKERTPLFVRKEHPSYVKRQFLRFGQRALAYFKGKELPPWFKYYADSDLYNPSDRKLFKRSVN